ncbi:MAG TPA: hypothetical protein PL124_04825 [Candidatus Cloacimonadota bacterium]|nr:hypothetical protein [Candidatus Cloacimonadota bacterium]HPS38718.1 hypothetical protein [Candidatus Cloacimonadota bacterium]
MRKLLSIISILLLLGCGSLSALDIILKDGIVKNYPNESFSKLNPTEIITYRTREEGVRKDVWQGIRFDTWLRDNNLRDFSTIRFESDDRYLVSFDKVAFDTTACWMVFQNDKEKFKPENYRIIFPNLMQNNWIRNISKVVLEDFLPISLPKKFHSMGSILSDLELVNNPSPFVDIQGYRFEDILKPLRTGKKADVVLFSDDGFKLRLSYPKHLKGAVLELTEAGNLNLKSPQIPGGMWVKNIVYIQINKSALIKESSANKLIDLNKQFNWNLGPKARVWVKIQRGTYSMSFADFLANPDNIVISKEFKLLRK